jgi:eukaryotic-like serine/threonine-protein kinase
MIGRYALFDVLAAGGMATVHIGRLLGPVGFARTVAIKRLHPQHARDPVFASMFLDEARMCARISHPNVVPTLDVVSTEGELFLVMEYVQGESLAQLIRAVRKRGETIPWRIAIAIAVGSLHGLHAAHEAKDERGLPLELVHRDVSPHNVLVGVDGMTRVVDFGVAKATGRIQATRDGVVKGKLGYMAPEQMAQAAVTRQADVYAAAVCLWEALAGRRLFEAETETLLLARVLTAEVPLPSSIAIDVPRELDEIVMKGIARNPQKRYASARQLAQALEKLGPASLGEVGDWVESIAKSSLEDRASKVAAVEEGCRDFTPFEVEDEVTPAARPATTGSIRPIATSGHGEMIARSKALPRWLAPAVVAGVAALSVGGWLVTRGGDAALGPTPAADSSSVSVEPGSSPIAVEPVNAAALSQSMKESGAVVVTPSAERSAPPPAPIQKPTRSTPVAPPSATSTGSPWSLGGRK